MGNSCAISDYPDGQAIEETKQEKILHPTGLCRVLLGPLDAETKNHEEDGWILEASLCLSPFVLFGLVFAAALRMGFCCFYVCSPIASLFHDRLAWRLIWRLCLCVYVYVICLSVGVKDHVCIRLSRTLATWTFGNLFVFVLLISPLGLEGVVLGEVRGSTDGKPLVD
jgi:hypothetical protein